jgi:parallel beta-helix repeat protein
MKSINHHAHFVSLTFIASVGLALLINLPAQTASAAIAPNASPSVIRVSTTIQAAVDGAQSGDTVLVPPSIYRENVLVTKDNITIVGSRGAVMNGTGLSGNTGIRVAPMAPATSVNGFTLSGLRIQNYNRNGVLLLRADNFHITEGVYADNGEYGIFPILSSNGLIDFNHVSGSDDTGIYVGQSHDLIIEDNHTSDCTLGIEIENSSRIVVRDNTAVENSIGIAVQLVPGLSVKVTSDVEVTNNKIIGNNRPNPVTDPDDLLSLLPSGIGFFDIGGDRVIVRHNIAIQNKSAGIVVIRVPPNFAALDPFINPFPDHNEIRGNVALQNGGDPDPKISPFPGSDLIWDFSGTDNCWVSNVFKTSFPALPACP